MSRKSRKEYTDKQKQDAVNRRVFGGETANEIAKDLDADPATICLWCRQAGHKVKPSRPHRHKIWDQVDPLLGTMTDGDLGERFGIHRQTIWHRRKKLDIPAFNYLQVPRLSSPLAINRNNGLMLTWTRSQELNDFIQYLENWKRAKRVYG